MHNSTLIKMLEVPKNKVDVVLDTDTFNEIDDQYAIAYLLRSDDKLNTKAIYAAPFFNSHSSSPENGMEKSYDEILKIVSLCGRDDLKPNIFKGSRQYLPDEKTPVVSPAAEDLAKRAMEYSRENPLYVVAIGAITNVASAILINPEITDKIVIVWLGGHGYHFPKPASEFNMRQDIAAARIVFGCGAPVVQLPCVGVVSEFRVSKPELEYWLKDKNPLADYLARNTIREVEDKPDYTERVWTRVIWDVTAVAWLLNEGGRFMIETIDHAFIPQYDLHYSQSYNQHFFKYVRYIKRDALMGDLFAKLLK